MRERTKFWILLDILLLSIALLVYLQTNAQSIMLG